MNQQTPDIDERVTRQIIEALESGAGGYRMPWHVTEADCFAPVDVHSRRPYRGINVLLLWLLSEKLGYPSGEWATCNQWLELGAQIRKGEKAALVVLRKVAERGRAETDDREQAKSTRAILAKGSHVFNVAQVEGDTPKSAAVLPESGRAQAAERFFSRLGVTVRHGGSPACHSPEEDLIRMPRFECFRDGGGYDSALAHEMTHRTGAPDRLNRDLEPRFAVESHAMEELVAELGAAFLCSALKLSNEPREGHAADLSGWLEVLEPDRRAIFTAASRAQKAVDWMHLGIEEQRSKAA